jgi:peptidoglycan-associated lipoprotein
MKKIIIPSILLLVIFSACNPLKKANTKYENGEYDLAIKYFDKNLNKGRYLAESNFKIAESYRLSNRIKKSVPYYKAALENGLNEESAEFYYGFALKSNGDYEAAEEQLSQYLKKASHFDFINRAKKELDNLRFTNAILRKGNYFEFKNVAEINTPDAEFSPFFINGELYFTSSRGGGKIYRATGTGFTNIWRSKMNGSVVDLKSLERLGDLINSPVINEGCATFTRDGKTMVFARGNSGRRKGAKEVNLYITRLKNGQWTEPELLPINDPNAWDSSPAFSRDGRVLYFASNREGGYGGIDLYSANMDANGRWGNVRNLGKDINTPGNEMFPYVSDDGRLFFSSSGHPGLGGLDLFVAIRRAGRITIENLGTGINSVDDDFGLIYFNKTEGFFCSNRAGGKGDDDIYYFKDNSPELKIINYILTGIVVTITEDGDEHVLSNSIVRLYDENENLIDEVTTNEDGKFSFRVDGEERYVLQGEKREYFTTRSNFSTIGKSIPQEELKQDVTNVTFNTKIVLDKIELNKAIVLDNIYYDFDRAEIRSDAAIELDKLVNILKDNPDIKIELSSHTDSRGDDDYNMRLSQRRAESAVNYIISKGISRDRITAKGYGETMHIIANAQTEEEHEKNRRTEFKVTEIKKKEEIKRRNIIEDEFKID